MADISGGDDQSRDSRVLRRCMRTYAGLYRQGRTMPRVGTAAQALNLSSEQFRKRLWRQLVLEARMVLGKNYLEATQFSSQEIAYLLDYAHPGAFTRAFKGYYSLP